MITKIDRLIAISASIFALIVLVLAIWVIPVSGKSITNTSLGITHEVQYYQSEWVEIPPMGINQFYHLFDAVPSFVEMYIPARLDGKNLDKVDFTVVYLYDDIGHQCLTIRAITDEMVSVLNNCDTYEIARVNALLIVP